MIVRIDDYPFGTPEDRVKYFPPRLEEMLQILDDAGIVYHLGIVPLYIGSRELNFLKTLKNAIFCLHGFDHGIPRWRPASESGGEFSSLTEDEIKYRLDTYNGLIRELNIDNFIPPFNSITQPLLDSLNWAGFKHIHLGPETKMFGMDKLNFGMLKQWWPTHYCKSSDITREIYTDRFPPQQFGAVPPLVVAFHLPWETGQTIHDFTEALTDRGLVTGAVAMAGLEQVRQIYREYDEAAGAGFHGAYQSLVVDGILVQARENNSREPTLRWRFISRPDVLGARILDLGCNIGGMGIEAVQRGAKSYVGWEISRPMLQGAHLLAREFQYQNKTIFTEGNLEEDNITGEYDTVFLFSVWSHLTNKLRIMNFIQNGSFQTLYFETGGGQNPKEYIGLFAPYFKTVELLGYLDRNRGEVRDRGLIVCRR